MANNTQETASFTGIGLAGRFGIAGGLLAIALGGAFVAIDSGLRHVQGEMESIIKVSQPMVEASFEMEINANEAGIGVLEYLQFLRFRDVAHRQKLQGDHEDFRRYLARFIYFATTDRQIELANRILVSHAAFVTTGSALLDAKDRIDRVAAATVVSVRDIARALDDEVEDRPLTNPRRHRVLIDSAKQLENAIWRLPLLLAAPNMADGIIERNVTETIQEIRARFDALARAVPEKSAAMRRLGKAFEDIATRIEALVQTQHEMTEGLNKFMALLSEMDQILDDDIQRLTGENLDAAMGEVLKEVQSSRWYMAAALAALLAVLIAMSVYIARWVVRPIKQLVDYAAEIGRGNFTASMEVTDAAEVGALARAGAEMSRSLQRAKDSMAREAAERVTIQETLGQSERLAAVGQLAGGIAHDFNNMLMVMGGYAERASKHAGEPEVVEKSLREIRGAIDSASKLVRQLSMFGGRRALDSRVFEVSRLKDDIDGLVQLTAGREQEIEYDFRHGARVKTDRGELTQAVLNLVTNASHASSPGSVIRISVDTADIAAGFAGAQPPLSPGRYVAVSVTDRGTGIPDRVLAHIFEPFFTTKEQGKGTGLGLSMVYGFAEKSGGGVRVTTKIGHGSTFSIYLPVSELAAEAVEARNASVPRGQGESILLVDDDERLVELTAEVLTELGYVVLAANGAFQAVEIAADELARIDLMLSDVVMPVMTGVEAYDIIKDHRPGLPVVFMSGSMNRYAEVTIPDHAQFLPKPVKTPDLARALRSALGDGAAKRPSPGEKRLEAV